MVDEPLVVLPRRVISARSSALRVAMALPASRSTSAATCSGVAIAPSPRASSAAASALAVCVRLAGSRSSALWTASASGAATVTPARPPSAAMGAVSTFWTMAASILEVKRRCREIPSQSSTPTEKTSERASGGGAVCAAMLLTRSGAAYERRSWFFAPRAGATRVRARELTTPPRRATPSSPTRICWGPSSP